MRKLRFRKVKCLVQRHTAIKWLWLKPSFIRFQSSCFSLSYLVLICTRGPGHKELEYGQTANYGDSGKLWGGPQRETSNKKCESPHSLAGSILAGTNSTLGAHLFGKDAPRHSPAIARPSRHIPVFECPLFELGMAESRHRTTAMLWSCSQWCPSEVQAWLN